MYRYIILLCINISMSNKYKNNDLPLMKEKDGIVLFYPHIPKSANKAVNKTLNSRWIGEGPKVKLFEKKFKKKFNLKKECLAVGSGTDALHLAYILSGIKKNDEVLVPLFTCTATNIPLLYIGAKIVFVDIDKNTLNICVKDLEKKITRNTKAIVVVHYGGIPCDMDKIIFLAKKFGLKVIEDFAHALGSKFQGKYIGNVNANFTVFSFQSIKHLTTGDGGMLILDKKYIKKARRLRWFGIDREKKQKGIWENDIKEVGYKYQMTDISAAIGLCGLGEYDRTLKLRRKLYERYIKNLILFKKIQIADDFCEKKFVAPWLFTVFVNRRDKLIKKLRLNNIKSGQTHYRNDRYSIFKTRKKFKNMDLVDKKYLILPLHTKMKVKDVDKICDVIKSGW